MARVDGYYWVEILEFGSICAVLHKDGTWWVEDPLADDEVSVISGPFPVPTSEQIAGHPERLAGIAQRIWDESGADPRWDGVHVDGVYWVQREGGPIELAFSFEGGWSACDWSDEDRMWSILPGGPPPFVLFGPLDKPGGWHHPSRWFEEFLAQQHEQAQPGENAKPRMQARKARRREPTTPARRRSHAKLH